MSKRYGLDGLGTNVELGKDGPRVKINSGQIEFKNAADDALVKIKALDGTSSDDLVTKSQLDAVDNSESIKRRNVVVDKDDSSAVNIGAAVTGTIGFRWQVNVTEVFDDGSSTLDLGVSGTPASIAANSLIDLTAVGQQSGLCNLDISSSTQMLATIDPKTSTTGIATVIVEYF